MFNTLKKIPYLGPVEDASKQFTISEKIVVFILTCTLFVGAIGMMYELDKYVAIRVPASGGSLSEGVVGTPRFINPLLALTDSDRDLVMLTYSGLMRATTDGRLVPDIASSYSVSDDGKSYIFTIKDNLKFHDDKPVTIDDIIFTIETVQNPLLKSIKRADWDGVQIKKTGENEVTFTLERPYSPFLENTTIGILPKHLWEYVNIQEFSYSKLNTNPVGSGPYEVDEISFSKSGIPNSYSLRAYDNYALGMPNIEDITIHFLSSKQELIEELETGTYDAVAGVPIDQDVYIQKIVNHITYPRIFAVFFNQDKNQIFATKQIRNALNSLINKESLINKVMDGHASALSSPIPEGILQGEDVNTNETQWLTKEERHEKAKNILESAGWEFSEVGEDENVHNVWNKDGKILEFTLTTAQTPELTSVAQILKSAWEEFGINVKVDIFDINELNQSIIRTRNYDALLFGEVVGRSLDLFAFWHSSQRDDPGLNIAMYANSKIDELLEQVRIENNPKAREDIYLQISEIMMDDIPSIFLYSPDFIYTLPSNVNGTNLKLLSTPSERFAEIHNWYIDTDRVWDIFIKIKQFISKLI